MPDIQVILGKHLKVGDVIPGSNSEYNRTIKEFDYVYGKVIRPWGSKRKVHSSINDTYRVAYFMEQHRLPMTVFDNHPINILYKKYRRTNKIK